MRLNSTTHISIHYSFVDFKSEVAIRAIAVAAATEGTLARRQINSFKFLITGDFIGLGGGQVVHFHYVIQLHFVD